jgi:hypothetical protein
VHLYTVKLPWPFQALFDVLVPIPTSGFVSGGPVNFTSRASLGKYWFMKTSAGLRLVLSCGCRVVLSVLLHFEQALLRRSFSVFCLTAATNFKHKNELLVVIMIKWSKCLTYKSVLQVPWNFICWSFTCVTDHQDSPGSISRSMHSFCLL